MASLASPDLLGPGAAKSPTRRVSLARAGATAINAVGDVRATAGPHGRWRTLDGGRSLDGVVAVEGADDRVELVLHTDVIWPPRPLADLADEVRKRTAAEAENSGRGEQLGLVRVFFHDVIDTAHGPAG